MSPKLKRPLLAAALVLVATGAAVYWLVLRDHDDNGAYIANGRLEAVEVQLASRLAGTVAKVMVEEGDPVTAGEPVIALDSQPLGAELASAQASKTEAEQRLDAAKAERQQSASECDYARAQLRRLTTLRKQRYVSEDQLDQARTRAETTHAGCNAAAAQVKAAQAAISVAEARVRRLQIDVGDLTLTAPIDARVLYRLVEPGEVVPAGGRVLTLVSSNNVYLTVFAPTDVAGRLRLGEHIDVVMDARPAQNVPTVVSFVSPEAQFTPKTVETQAERAKLMFRIKLRVEPGFLRANQAWLKPGMPGEARLPRTDTDTTASL